jgi:5-methylcytosine-specific restriction endonuclease McrA
MPKSNIINWPNQTKLTGRSSTITSAFVHSITPWLVTLTSEEEKDIRDLYAEVKNVYGIEILGADKKDNKCAYCGQPANTTDHIHPLVNGANASGDITEIYNLLPCCASCNSSKRGESFATWYDKKTTESYVDSVGGDYANRKKALLYLISELDKKSSAKKILDFHRAPEGVKRLTNIYKHRDEVNALMRKYEEECLRFAFDAEMSMKKIGEIAQTKIPAVLRKKKHLISDFMDAKYCKNEFKVYYPILSKNEIIDANGIKRTYTDTIKIGKNDYYLCSQWHERCRKALLDWLWLNRK